MQDGDEDGAEDEGEEDGEEDRGQAELVLQSGMNIFKKCEKKTGSRVIIMSLYCTLQYSVLPRGHD